MRDRIAPDAMNSFKNHSSPGRGYKSQMLCYLGLQLKLLKPATPKSFLANNSPILSILFHENIFKAANHAIESTQPFREGQGQRIDDLHEMEQPANPSSEAEEQKTSERSQADEPTSGAEELETQSQATKEYDDMSSLCYTQAAEILDRVLYGGNQSALANFANLNCESESENPIPPEYEAGTEFLYAALKQFPVPPPKNQTKAGARHQTHEDPPDFVPPPLSRENLKKNRAAFSPSIAIPSRPYPFMKNPRHLDPSYMPHDQNDSPLECWDGCIDCEVYVAGMGSRLWKVHHWFENYFTHHAMYRGDFGKNPSHPSLKHPEPDPDDDEGNIYLVKREYDDDFLLGAEGPEDFPFYKQLWLNEPEDTHQDIATLLVQYMQLGESIDGGYLKLNYYYGERFNAILQEYEPRVLPNVGFGAQNKLYVLRYPGIDDMSKPIWDVTGCPFPMQLDFETRMGYTRMEYNRKLLMSRAQDEARQRYVQQVREAAHYEYIQRGLLEWSQ